MNISTTLLNRLSSGALAKPTLITAAILAVSARAQIITDRTFGKEPVSLSGPDVQIPANLGGQKGPNLFHSFLEFSIRDPQHTATFLPPSSDLPRVDRILARVTGQAVSELNGTLRSEIPGADLYFINPHGVIFGASARIDVDGAVSISTADYLRLGDSGTFNARNPASSSLTVDSPSAFGFGASPPGPVTFQGTQLAFPHSREVTVVGGSVTLQEGASIVNPGGRTHLASKRQNAEEFPVSGEQSPDPRDGEIIIRGGSSVHATPEPDSTSGPGVIRLVGGRIIIDGGTIQNDTVVAGATDTGAQTTLEAGEKILMQNRATLASRSTQSEGPGGNLVVSAPSIEITTGEGAGARVLADTSGGLEGTDLTISGGNISIRGGFITVTTHDDDQPTSKGAQLHIQAETLEIQEQALITADNDSRAETAGAAPTVLFEAEHALVTGSSEVIAGTGPNALGRGADITFKGGELEVSGGAILQADTFGAGPAGNIVVRADSLSVRNGGRMTVVATEGASAPAGRIDVSGRASDTWASKVEIQGQRNGFTGLFADSESLNPEANSGSISLGASEVTIAGGKLRATTIDAGGSPEITINADRLTLREGAELSTSSSGRGATGSIDLRTSDQITMVDSAIVVSAPNATAGAIQLLSGGGIDLAQSVLSAEGNEGGNIRISATRRVYIHDLTRVSASAGSRQGGDIYIAHIDPDDPDTLSRPVPGAVVLSRSSLSASAVEGNGGRISIAANGYLRSADTGIQVSSVFGEPGEAFQPSFIFEPPSEPPPLQTGFIAPLEWEPPGNWESQDPEGYTPLQMIYNPGATQQRLLLGR